MVHMYNERKFDREKGTHIPTASAVLKRKMQPSHTQNEHITRLRNIPIFALCIHLRRERAREKKTDTMFAHAEERSHYTLRAINIV